MLFVVTSPGEKHVMFPNVFLLTLKREFIFAQYVRFGKSLTTKYAVVKRIKFHVGQRLVKKYTETNLLDNI